MNMKNTEYIALTELWQDGKYNNVANTINNENWSPRRVAEFCVYFNKYLGTEQLNILHKLL
jgi:hypothetical protein